MKIAIVAGCNRRNSSSTMMAKFVGERLKSAGHVVNIWDLYDEPLPFYDPDDETESDTVTRLAQMVAEADAVVLSTPEYHGSVSGVLKNALDYLGSEHFDGKMVLCISSAGGSVGVSSLQHMQVIVRNLHGISCPEWISIGGDQRRFDEQGEPAHAAVRARVDRVLMTFVSLAGKMRIT
ncbi:NADPH-dependent FMN reductase [Cohnella silvisoli]|uniref:NADPH-dependent FMN reductase n=1 Tax=Cohnella silvisoli TaxID=2873699 RepID=A0ABV1KP56_9BACL|nr:NADPH-dependent FMN reductase [Cohnella silvisoli]MCD9025650.1 NAD(P)H-dependent oxidoreductase [Cohnella silvisoli]